MAVKTIIRKIKSVPLSKEQTKMLRERMKLYGTKVDAAISLGVSREVMERMLTYGSCSEKTFRRLFPGALEELGVVTTKLPTQNKKFS